MRTLKPSDLPFLDLILANDRHLADRVFGRLEAMLKAVAPPSQPPAPEPAPGAVNAPPATQADAAALDDRIAAWFGENPGKHPPSAIMLRFGNTKSTKRSLARLVAEKRIAWNGKRGPGSEYGTK